MSNRNQIDGMSKIDGPPVQEVYVHVTDLHVPFLSVLGLAFKIMLATVIVGIVPFILVAMFAASR